MWLILVFVATVCFAIARVLQKSLLNNVNHDPITYAIYFQLVVAMLVLPIALFNGFSIPPLGQIWPNLLLTAFLYCLGNIFSFRSLKKIPVSEFTILAATIPIWATLTAVLFLHESAHPIKLLGVLLTVAGIVAAFYTGKKFALTKGHYAALLAAIAWGCAFTNDAYLLHSFNASTYSFVYWFWPGIVLGALYYKKLRGISHFVKNGVWKFLAPAALFALASLAINTSYKLGAEASQLATIIQFGTIITIIFGVVFLGEKENLAKKILGGLIVILGVILVQVK